MPMAVASYAAANPDFPHESTADQWFSESQFESYRGLGYAMADTCLTEVFERGSKLRPAAGPTPEGSAMPLTIDELIAALK